MGSVCANSCLDNNDLQNSGINKQKKNKNSNLKRKNANKEIEVDQKLNGSFI